ncbi:MAG TPA: PEP-CTERM sorting domain-containing protein [Armatimonadota bacterium]|nr:PEP-CTERM sorting domain-containing protein [Armatimonadota bacterium]
MSFKFHLPVAVSMMVLSAAVALGAPMLLNEYNGVKDGGFIKDGGTDTYFGTVDGNGGDWMEFVVVQDNLDIRGWQFVTYQANAYDGTVTLPSLEALGSLRSGTIFTIAEMVATDLSYSPVFDEGNPAAGDWWINYQAAFSDGNSTHKDFQVTILDAMDNVIFGPAGEGTSLSSGIGNDEVFKLEADPSDLITALSPYYNDGTSSTFGSPNKWSKGTITQDFSQLRRNAAVPEPATLAYLLAGLPALSVIRRRRK